MVGASWRIVPLICAFAVIGCAKRTNVNTDPPPVQTNSGPGAAPASGSPSSPVSTDDEARRRNERLAAINATLSERIYFDYDLSAVSAEAQRILQAKVAVLRENPELRIRIEGHADERGSDQYNDALGQQRAAAVRRYMADYGIPESRLEMVSFGEQRPTCQSDAASCWSQNRRAEFQITSGTTSIR